MGTKRDEHKGGPIGVRDPLKQDPRHTNRTETRQNETHTTQFV
nr:MAG TPA: hypothetical protein [Caudoviricetes sp.]